MSAMRSKWLLILLPVILAGYFVYAYNRLIALEEGVKLAWSELQNVYKRRMDLVPSLVGIVKGTAAYEQEVLQQVVQARSKAVGMSLAGKEVNYPEYRQQEEMQSELAGAVNKLIAVVEAYPELKGTQSFLNLQTQLEGTERRIKVAREDFNDAVNRYNTFCRRFPASLVAAIAGFKVRDGFSADSNAGNPVEVKF